MADAPSTWECERCGATNRASTTGLCSTCRAPKPGVATPEPPGQPRESAPAAGDVFGAFGPPGAKKSKSSKWDKGAPDPAPLLRKNVVVSGLSKQTELNGLIGFTLDFDAPAGRYVVDIKGTTYRLKTVNLQEAPPKTLVGKLAEVIGLLNKPHLNGKTGIASEFDAAAGRYTINIEGKIFKLKPENLQDASHKLKEAPPSASTPWQPAAPPTIPSSTPPSEMIGKLIEVQGLTSKPELNGARALVKAFHFDVDRFSVELSDNQGTFKLRMDNMIDLTMPPEPAKEEKPPTPEVIMTKTITVNATHKGRMIGSGGEHIKKIQQESEAGIEILSPPAQPDVALIRVTGTAAQIESAEKMVEDRLVFVREKLMQQVAQAAKDVAGKGKSSWNSGKGKAPAWKGGGGGKGGKGGKAPAPWQSWKDPSQAFPRPALRNGGQAWAGGMGGWPAPNAGGCWQQPAAGAYNPGAPQAPPAMQAPPQAAWQPGAAGGGCCNHAYHGGNSSGAGDSADYDARRWNGEADRRPQNQSSGGNAWDPWNQQGVPAPIGAENVSQPAGGQSRPAIGASYGATEDQWSSWRGI